MTIRIRGPPYQDGERVNKHTGKDAYMKLYEINEAILRTLEEYTDSETGEVIGDPVEMQDQLDALEMERSRILEYLAKLTLNKRSEAAAVKDEEKRLADRRRRLEREENRLLAILDRECAGVKTDLGVATVSYRKSTPAVIDDERQAIEWLEKNGYDDCLKYEAPSIRKDMAKSLIQKQGIAIPGLHVEERRNMSLR